ncbi:MAG: helix-turn-helix transcriptional regulator [Chloroflexi bacterium]|nr:helix-turn-helix transcriptional regulator [Chloroflexota bacterium]
MEILTFDDINASHAATGYHGRTDLPAFHIFSVEDTYPSTRPFMPPYTLNFYQVVLLEDSADAVLSMNADAIHDPSDTVTFASPQHVLAWVRGQAQKGVIVYFKPEFLIHHPLPIPDDFPFFRPTELNLLRVSSEEKDGLRGHFAQLAEMYAGEHPYRVPMLQALLLILLYECKRLYDLQAQQETRISPQIVLADRFRTFVEQHFITRKTVESYADLLAVSPDHLSYTVKAVTGKTAHRLIVERVVLEAKKLLTYTDLNAAEIAHFLGFDEPTHFGRFFRRYVGTTPLAWRQAQSGPPSMRLPGY